jgi:diguanylate cyclase (GGDEF)-like protein
MVIVRPSRRRKAGGFGAQRVRGWQLWSLNAHGVAYILIAELAAVGLVLTALATERSHWSDWGRVALLVGLSATYAEFTDRVERLRRFLGSDKVFADRESVWSFAAVLVLPIGYAGLVVITLYGLTLVRSIRHKSARAHRLIFTAATATLAAVIAGLLLHVVGTQLANGAGAAVATVLALLAYTGTSFALMAGGVYLATRPPKLRQLVPGRDDAISEGTALILGAITAVLVWNTPWLTPASLILLGVLHRASLVQQLQVAARTDSKTGLLHAGAWQDLARDELARSARDHSPATVLLLDLDLFKKINDTYGHIVGDHALQAVADCLRRELRSYDAVGRYGGEEFVALLAGVDSDEANDIAERIHTRIRALELDSGARVTASIGLAHYPHHAFDVTDLLQQADTALFAAKAAGRNCTRTAALKSSAPTADNRH